jgi:hypothetical protein
VSEIPQCMLLYGSINCNCHKLFPSRAVLVLVVPLSAYVSWYLRSALSGHNRNKLILIQRSKSRSDSAIIYMVNSTYLIPLDRIMVLRAGLWRVLSNHTSPNLIPHALPSGRRGTPCPLLCTSGANLEKERRDGD